MRISSLRSCPAAPSHLIDVGVATANGADKDWWIGSATVGMCDGDRILMNVQPHDQRSRLAPG
jgi:hypothetical protein